MDLDCLVNNGIDVGGETLQATEESLRAQILRDQNTLNHLLEMPSHVIPIGVDLAEAEILGDAIELSWCALELKEA